MNHCGHDVHDEIPRDIEELGRAVMDCAFKVHRALGPGLLESVHEHRLAHELGKRKVPFRRQVQLPITYDGERPDSGLRIDLVVGEAVIVELKTVEALSRLHDAQILTYLKLSRYRLGFLINFYVVLLRDGFRRFVL